MFFADFFLVIIIVAAVGDPLSLPLFFAEVVQQIKCNLILLYILSNETVINIKCETKSIDNGKPTMKKKPICYSRKTEMNENDCDRGRFFLVDWLVCFKHECVLR